MGLRFRKSIKIAPGLKLNFNKNSVSATFGKRGAHYTINSKGKKTATIGIPGTGLSYSTTSGGTSTHSPKHSNTGIKTAISSNNTNHDNNGKKWYQKTGWIITLLFLFFPVGLFLMWKYTNWNKYIKIGISAFFAIMLFVPSSKDLEKIVLNANTTLNYDISEKIPIECTTTPADYVLTKSDFNCTGGSITISSGKIYFSSSSAGTYEIYAKNSDVQSNTIAITIEDKAAIEKAKAEEEARLKAEEEAKQKAEEEAKQKAEEEARKKAEAEKQQSSVTETTPKENMVWISDSGHKYHSKSSCSNMKNPTQISESEAIANKYEPCKRCH